MPENEKIDTSNQTTHTQDAAKMLSLVSHKLRTPLSIINGYSEAILSQSSKEKFSPFTSKALEEINKQGVKLCALVDKLMFFNKVENLQPKDLAKKQINLLRRKYHEKGSAGPRARMPAVHPRRLRLQARGNKTHQRP